MIAKCQLWSQTKCVGIVDSVYGELQVEDTFPDSVHSVCLQSFLPLRCLIVMLSLLGHLLMT